jgi:lipid A ethanolaminephosphotransferase
VPGVVSYPDVTSCGTNTAASLPCMVSLLGREGHLAAEVRHENLLDLVQRAGMAVLWLDNQSGCKGLCDRVPNAWAHTPPAGAPALPAGLCTGEECLDAALLLGLDERLAALPAEQRAKGVLLVLHQMGSHGPAYHRRSPAERKPFTPECTSPTLAQCAVADLVNTYDNSIAYTDHVLAQATVWLGRQAAAHEPALLYVSDHGESLGENNVYLHGLPYAVAPRAQTHVPMIAWWPDTPGAPLDRACVAAAKAAPLSHDHLSHTVIGWLGITASEYRPAFDAWAACRRKG